jgi:hypothetical protein
MGTYAANTEVSQEKSRAEIETTLRRYGADAFSYGWEEGRAVIAFRASKRQVRFEITMPERDDKAFTEYTQRGKLWAREPSTAQNLWEKACRQRWRALALVVKAKLEAVDAGISEFEEEFLAHIVLPDGSLVGKHIKPHLEKAYADGKMPRLMLGTSYNAD